ncbi:MAG TPA: DUF58 domain-containing protein [bacterium]|nr:DUF58 domain-containing protein [bacterium]
MSAPRLLTAATVARLGAMDVRARTVVEGFVAGLHKSPYKGFSVEFAEHRQYMPGDPPKTIDWKVYGKSDRFYVKEFEEETNLRAYLVIDGSASMGFTTGEVSKFDYARYLAAALSYLMIRQQDSVGMLLFDEEIRKFIPPRSAGRHLHIILNELENARAASTTGLAATLHRLAERVKRRGLVILMSDLFDDQEKVLFALRHFRHKKNEVVLFHILDPAERDFAFQREAVFEDMETADRMLVRPWEIRNEYRDAVRDWMDRYSRICREIGVDYVPMHTETPFDTALLAYLEKRSRLG